jgi:hypothetical protein
VAREVYHCLTTTGVARAEEPDWTPTAQPDQRMVQSLARKATCVWPDPDARRHDGLPASAPASR